MGITLPANLNVYLSAALFVLGAYLFALYLGMVVWTFRDIHGRSRDVLGQIMATLLVLVFTLPGLLVYLLLRPRNTLAEEYERDLAEEAMLQSMAERHICPKCHRRAEPDFILCPSCHQQLRLRCVSCGRLLNPKWDICPYCGVTNAQFKPGDKATTKPEAAPVTPASAPAPLAESAPANPSDT